MTQVIATAEAPQATTQTEGFELAFVQDADYEFVGGGNAVNAY